MLQGTLLENLQEAELFSIKQKVTDVASEVCQELQEIQQNNSGAESQVAHPSAPKPKKRNLATLFKDYESRIRAQKEEQAYPFSVEEHHRQMVTKEMDGYLSGHRLDLEENPLVWWKSQQSNFPVLAKLAKKYLCICASSLASERLFSSAGNVISPFRAATKPEKVDMLVFLSKKNL